MSIIIINLIYLRLPLLLLSLLLLVLPLLLLLLWSRGWTSGLKTF